MTNVTLELVGQADVDQEELDELGLSLRRRLLELDVADVRALDGGIVPEGAKSGVVVATGVLVATMAPGLVRAVLHAVETWLQNRPVRKVTVNFEGRSIELEHASPADQQRLIEGFLSLPSLDEGGASSDAG